MTISDQGAQGWPGFGRRLIGTAAVDKALWLGSGQVECDED